MPTTVDREKREARRAFRNLKFFAEELTIFLTFVNTGHAEPPPPAIPGLKAFSAFDRDAHALARQLWDVCVDVVTDMQKEAQRGEAQTVFDDRYRDALNIRLDAIEAAARAEPTLRFHGAVFWFSYVLTHFVYPARFRAVSLVVQQCLQDSGEVVSDRADGNLGATFRCIGRCLNESCQQWFFAMDDRQIYCQDACRDSRQPAMRRTAVTAHRARKRRRL